MDSQDIQHVRETLDEVYKSYILGRMTNHELNATIGKIKDNLPESVSIVAFLDILGEFEENTDKHLTDDEWEDLRESYEQYESETKHLYYRKSFAEWLAATNSDISAESDTSDKHLQWFVIGQSGWVWVVWHIIGIPANEDVSHIDGVRLAYDGSHIWPQPHLFRTEAEARAFASNREFADMYDKTDIVDLSDNSNLLHNHVESVTKDGEILWDGQSVTYWHSLAHNGHASQKVTHPDNPDDWHGTAK